MTLSSPSLVWTREYTCLEHTLIMWRVATWQPPPQTLRAGGRLTSQFMAPASSAALAPRNFRYLIIERRSIPSQVSNMIMNYIKVLKQETQTNKETVSISQFAFTVWDRREINVQIQLNSLENAPAAPHSSHHS